MEQFNDSTIMANDADLPRDDSSGSAEMARVEFLRTFEEFEDSVALNQRVFEAVQKELGRIAAEFYPGMKTCWQAEQLRALADRSLSCDPRGRPERETLEVI